MNQLLRVNLVTRDKEIQSRLEAHTDILRSYDIILSARPQYKDPVDAYVLPADGSDLKRAARALSDWAFRLYYGESGFLRAAYLAGADDYMKDPWSLDELVFRLGKAKAHPALRFPWGSVVVLTGEVVSTHGSVRVSSIESSILVTLIRERGRVVPRRILIDVAGCATDPDSRAIDMHISSLRKKLREVAPEDYDHVVIRSAYRGGYFIPENLC